jgi:hypothetical protein
MALLNSLRGLGASRATVVALMLFAFTETAHAEIWNLEVETARVVTGQSSDDSFLRIRLTENGADQFRGLLEQPKTRVPEAKELTWELRVHRLDISTAAVDLKRRELRVFMRGLDGEKLQALAERLSDKRARSKLLRRRRDRTG